MTVGAVFCAQVELTFEHLDFTWGMTAHIRVYPEVVRLLLEDAYL